MPLNIRGSGKIKDTPSPALCEPSLLTGLFCSHAYDLYHTLKCRSCYLAMA